MRPIDDLEAQGFEVALPVGMIVRDIPFITETEVGVALRDDRTRRDLHFVRVALEGP
ncbi:MAG: hypothetical protein ACFCGT_07610 [Sandaracinaceae bacterium]